MHRTRAACRAVLAAALLLGATACSGGPQAASPPTSTGDLPTAGVPVGAPPVPALQGRLRPDVLVLGRLTGRELGAVSRLAPGAVAYSVGTATIGSTKVRVAAVDPLTFRRFTVKGTAEATAVWQAVAAGQAIASHALASKLRLKLGSTITVTGRTALQLRLGGLATTGIPDTELVVARATGAALRLATSTAVLLNAGKVDPVVLASKARKATGRAADVRLLSQPAQDPVAFLTGGRAARAFGGFSYTYYPDGTIVPEARWVRANIVSARLPIIGLVTCHRLMIPQLRAALQEVKDAGLAAGIQTYNGCYVPRFIERDPSHGISLHTWGIAIDFNAATNYRGIEGTMDPRIVKIFKRWGFRWGGDWSYSDPMHFELGALLRTS